MKVQVIFKDGVCIVVDNITSDCRRDMVTFYRNDVNDTDFIDWCGLKKRYKCVVYRAPKFGEKTIVIVMLAKEIKQVEFID